MTLYALTDNSRTCAASSKGTDNGCGWTETTNNPLVNDNHYNGLDLTVTRRLVGRWSALAGFTVQKNHGVQVAGDFNDPNLNINRYGALDQDSEFVVRAGRNVPSCRGGSRPRSTTSMRPASQSRRPTRSPAWLRARSPRPSICCQMEACAIPPSTTPTCASHASRPSANGISSRPAVTCSTCSNAHPDHGGDGDRSAVEWHRQRQLHPVDELPWAVHCTFQRKAHVLGQPGARGCGRLLTLSSVERCPL